MIPSNGRRCVMVFSLVLWPAVRSAGCSNAHVSGAACSADECLNGGVCAKSAGADVCRCPAGYTGSRCETATGDACTPNPCQNGGICQAAAEAEHTCECPSGFAGQDCEDYGSTYYPTYSIPVEVPEEAVFVDTENPAASDTNPGTETFPWKTIKGALSNIASGSDVTLVVKGGDYYESDIRLISGTDGHPFTFMAYPGHRVTLIGFVPLDADRGYSWTAVGGGIFRADLAWKPAQLLRVDDDKYVRLDCARDPKGWLEVDSVVNSPATSFTDAALVGYPVDIFGGEVFFYLHSGDVTDVLTITGFDSASGTVSTTTPLYGQYLSPKDRYWIQNRIEFITTPGDWAVVKNGSVYQLYYKPIAATGGAIADHIVAQGSGDWDTVSISNASFTKVIGFEITGGQGYGLRVTNSSNILLARNTFHNNLRFGGVYLSGNSDIVFARNLVRRNDQNGLVTSNNTNLLIERCDFGYNGDDGLNVTTASQNVTIQKNFIHHSLRISHPDGIHFWGTVNDATIHSNLILAVGQALTMEDTTHLGISNNLIVGANGPMLQLFGADNSIYHNTLVHAYYGNIDFRGTGYYVSDNVVMKGNAGRVFSVADSTNYAGNHNLFYNSDGADEGVVDDVAGYNRTLVQFQADTGQDASSAFGNPQFTSVPEVCVFVDIDWLVGCTSSRLIVNTSQPWFDVGDRVEINFDGVERTITGNSDYDTFHYALDFAPPLDAPPFRYAILAKWKNGVQPLDATLLPGSPGIGLASLGGAVGSDIDAQSYMAGDFDEDGVRDLPDILFE
jgi:parallel beta-helix repeat protein